MLTTEQEFISVTVHNPTIHNTYEDGRFTTFDVELQTNSLSFTTKHSVVQRRYSDFQWLRKALARTTGGSPPSLPFGRIFGTFDEEFLQERQKVLTDFMQRVVRDTLFVASSALHLFLQTELSRKDMDALIKEAKRRGSMNAVARAISMYGPRYNKLRTRHSVSCLARNGTAFEDRNIGSKSVPAFETLLFKRESSLVLNSSQSDLSPSSVSGHSSARRDSQAEAPHPTAGSFFIGQDPLTEVDYGEWVLIKSSSTNSLDNCGAQQSPVNMEDYTDVSWTVGDNQNSSNKIEKTFKSKPDFQNSSDFIPVPFTHRLKNLISGQYLSQSLDNAPATAGTDFKNPEGETIRRGGEIRRVASDTNVNEKYIESPPFKCDDSPQNFTYFVPKNSNSLRRKANCVQSTPKSAHSSPTQKERHSDSLSSSASSQEPTGSVLRNGDANKSGHSSAKQAKTSEDLQLQASEEYQNHETVSQKCADDVNSVEQCQAKPKVLEQKIEEKKETEIVENNERELIKPELQKTTVSCDVQPKAKEVLVIVTDSNAKPDAPKEPTDPNKLDENSNEQPKAVSAVGSQKIISS